MRRFLLHMDIELMNRLAKIAKKLHISRAELIRTLILEGLKCRKQRA